MAKRTSEAVLIRAEKLLDSGRARGGLRAADEALELAPEDAEGHYLRGMALTLLDRIEEADRAFARASELDPESFFVPHRVEDADFERVVEEALAALPARFREYLENVEIAVEDVPDRNLLGAGEDPFLLGLYQGGTIHDESWDLPDRILLFQRNLENVSEDEETLFREIRHTLLHEVGHHMGMEEEDLEPIEREWENE